MHQATEVVHTAELVYFISPDAVTENYEHDCGEIRCFLGLFVLEALHDSSTWTGASPSRSRVVWRTQSLVEEWRIGHRQALHCVYEITFNLECAPNVIRCLADVTRPSVWYLTRDLRSLTSARQVTTP